MTERWEITTAGLAVEAKFFRDDFQIYRFGSATMDRAIARLAENQFKLKLFPVPLKGRKDVSDHIIAREIYYREFPAFIADFDGERGRVLIRPDNLLGRKTFPPDPWDVPPGPGDPEVWEDLLSPKIHWFRGDANV
jgi:hypothetical protein